MRPDGHVDFMWHKGQDWVTGILSNPSSTVSALIRHKMLEFSKDFEPLAAVRT
jgi:hypothetical protein